MRTTTAAAASSRSRRMVAAASSWRWWWQQSSSGWRRRPQRRRRRRAVRLSGRRRGPISTWASSSWLSVRTGCLPTPNLQTWSPALPCSGREERFYPLYKKMAHMENISPPMTLFSWQGGPHHYLHTQTTQKAHSLSIRFTSINHHHHALRARRHVPSIPRDHELHPREWQRLGRVLPQHHPPLDHKEN